MRRKRAAVFTTLLVAVLGFAGTYRALAQSGPCAANPDNCTDQGDGNGQGGGTGGGGGGMSSGGGDSGNQPGQPGGAGGTPGGGSSGTGGGGNGANGGAGGNVDARKTPEPSAGTDSGGGSGTRTAASSTSPHATDAAGGFTDDRLATWAQRFSTNPDEVKSWFGNYTANDSLGGGAAVLVVHPDDEVTVFDGATGNDAGAASGSGNLSDGTGDRGALRSGVKGIGDSSNKGGDDVQINLHSQAVALGNTVTQVGGRFSGTVRIPKSTSAGLHFLVALVANANQGHSAFVFPVTVAVPAAAAPVADTTQPASSPKHFPWVLVELLVGTASVIALFVVRVRRATAGVN